MTLWAHKDTIYNIILVLDTLPRNNNTSMYCIRMLSNNSHMPYSVFLHGWKFLLFNFSWFDILAFGATLHRILFCIVEEILVELILAL